MKASNEKSDTLSKISVVLALIVVSLGLSMYIFSGKNINIYDNSVNYIRGSNVLSNENRLMSANLVDSGINVDVGATASPTVTPSSYMPSVECPAIHPTRAPATTARTYTQNLNANVKFYPGDIFYAPINKVNYMIIETSGPNIGDICFYTREILDPLTYYFSPTNYTRYLCLECYSACPSYATMNNGYLK